MNLELNYCPVQDKSGKTVRYLVQVASQKERNEDEDENIQLYYDEDLDMSLTSCGELAFEGSDGFFVRGYVEDEDDKIIILSAKEYEQAVTLVWKYNVTTSNNTLEPADVFLLKKDLHEQEFGRTYLGGWKVCSKDPTLKICGKCVIEK
jgi:hypothetical protein